MNNLLKNLQPWLKKLERILNKPVVFVLPYVLFFIILILLPILVSAALSLTYFDTIKVPLYIGFDNFINLLTNDNTFMQNAIPNTFIYAVIVGSLGYALSFFFAWLLSQVTPRIRTLYTLAIFSPSITGPVMMSVIWKVLFSGDQRGYLNYFLINLGWIQEPIQFLTDPSYLSIIIIIVGLWSSAGLGFLAMLAGMLNIDATLYEAGAIDGVQNRWQEIFYITIPSMRPQMLFGAVMAIVGAFNVSGVAVALSGGLYPPQNAGWMILDHANDFGFIRYEMGYAAAITVFLFIGVILLNKFSYRLFGEKE